MAQYRLKTEPISRSKGRPATSAAAYHAAEQVKDQRLGKVFSYTKKKGVLYTGIITPDGSQISREELWNAAECAENRKDARTAREWILNLPHELNLQQKIALTKEFSEYLVKTHGVAADFAVHEPDPKGDPRNWHGHILTTTRLFEGGELTQKTDFELGDKDRKKKGLKRAAVELTEIREVFEIMTNKALERANIDARVTSKKNPRRIPTIHLGPRLTALERKGIRTHKGDINRLIAKQNALIEEASEINKELILISAKLETIEAEIIQQMEMEQKQKAPQTKHDLKQVFGALAEQAKPKKPDKLQPSREATRWKKMYLAHYQRIARNIDIKSVSQARLDIYISLRLLKTGHHKQEVIKALYYARRAKYNDTRAKKYAQLIVNATQNNDFDLSFILPNLHSIENQIQTTNTDIFSEQHVYTQYKYTNENNQLKEQNNAVSNRAMGTENKKRSKLRL